jgi:CHAD domain-containing protein
MNAQSLLSNALKTRWDDYKIKLRACRANFSEEAVHNFRVAVRRLLAALDLLHSLTQNIKIKKIRRALKDQLDHLDALRDTQVLLADIFEYRAETPQRQPFEEYLQGRQKKLMRAAHKEIKLLKIKNLAAQVRKLKQTLTEFQPNEINPLAAIDEAYQRLIQRQQQIDSTQPATIHHLRIAFKKFRYMVEVIHPLLEKFSPDTLKKMRDYQTRLGKIQDMEAALQTLAAFERHASQHGKYELLRAYYQKRQTLAIAFYMEAQEDLVAFWRPASH